MSKEKRRMVMTLERIDQTVEPAGQIRVTDLRPMTRFESVRDWFSHLRKKRNINVADMRGLDFEPGSPISVGIEISPEIYVKLVGGYEPAVQAVEMLRDQPISMSLVVPAEPLRAPDACEMTESVV